MRRARRLALGLICLTAPTVQAFEWTSIGIKAGVGRVSTDIQFEGEELFDPGNEITPVGGISAQWRLSRQSRFDLMTEVWLLRPGFSTAGEFYQADFLAFPLLVRSAVRRDDPQAYVFFGLCPEFLIGADDHPVLDRYNNFALAGQAGIGVEKRFDRHFTGLIEFRFSAEFTNLYDDTDTSPISNLTHRWLQLMTGARF